MRVLDSYPWVRERLEGVREDHGGQYVTADCPIRCHSQARLRLWVGENGCLCFTCWAGCPKLDMLRAVGCSWKDCFPGGTMPDFPKQEVVARYPYQDEAGRLLYQTVRLEPGLRGRDKDFKQRRPDGAGKWVWNLGDVRRVLYRLPELLAAKPDRPVFVVGGEKDADTLRAVGEVATTNVGGERAEWLESYSAALAGRHVVVVEDADATGRRHASEVCGALIGYAASVRRVRLPTKDVTALVVGLRANGVTTPAELRGVLWENVERFPRWEPCEV